MIHHSLRLFAAVIPVTAGVAGLCPGDARAQFVSLSSVGSDGYAAGDINSCAVGLNTLTTAGNHQFIAYYSSTGQLMVGRRTLGSSTWTTYNSGYTQTGLSDDHNVVSMTVDSAGKMHLSWGMHNVGLKYAISSASVTSTTLSSIAFTTQTSANAPTLFAGPSNSVTYPQFYDIPDSSPDGSKLLFTYRNGSSGSGNQYVNVYSPATNSWTNSYVINGNATSVNAYLNSMAYTSTNNLLMSWTWRATPDWQTNSNIMFAQSPNNGTTWYKQGGTTQYTLPIIQSGTPATSVAQVVKNIPQNSSLINQTSMTVDAANNPLVATWWAPNWDPASSTGDPNRQYMLVFYDGSAWRTSQITNRITDTAIDTSAFAVRDLGRPIVLTDDNDHVLVVTRSTDTSMGNYDNPAVTDNELVVYYNTLTSLRSATPAAWQSVTLDTANMGSYEPTYDASLWKSQRKLSLFYQQLELGQASSPVSVLDWDSVAYFANPLNHWNSAVGGNWDTAGNWTLSVPNAASASASFGTGPTAPTADSVITINGSKTLGSLTFSSATYDYSLVSGSGGALVLNNGASAAAITVSSGSHTIAVPVTLSSAGNTIATTGGAILTLSGSVTGSGGMSKTGSGTLVLSGNNTYSGVTSITAGTLRAVGAGALSPNSNLSINGGMLEPTVNLTRTIGAGAGQIQISGGAGGFSASSADVTVTLNNGGSPIAWGSASFAPSTLVLNSSASHSVTLAANIDLNGATRTIQPDGGVSTLSGAISGSSGLLRVIGGSGILALSNSSNNYGGGTTIGTTAGGVIRAAASNALGTGNVVIAANGNASTGRLELIGGITLPSAITFSGRNNDSVGIENIGGNNTIAGVMTMNVGGNRYWVQSDSGTLNLTGSITSSASGGRTLTLQGAASGNVSGAIQNGTATMQVTKADTGTWTLSGANTYTGATSVNAGTLLIGQSSRTSSALNVADGARAGVAPRSSGGKKTLQIGTMNLNTSGTLDLNDNDIVVDNGSFATIKSAVLAGFGTSGPGIISSTTDGSQILALFDNALIGAGAWNGGTIGASAIVGKYTYFGDANFDGQVTGDDYTIIDSNLNTTPQVGLEWLSGDANLDGIVTGDDYTTVDSNLGLGMGNPLTSAALQPSESTAVPEPAVLTLFLTAALAIARRRRNDFPQPARS